MGRVVTASVFSNCDIQMLHYSYYRTKETVLASFKARFVYILRCNFLITTVMAISAIGVISSLSWQFDVIRSAVFFLVLTYMGLFFFFYDLFLYYVIQPYDSAGKSKSMIYAIINGVVYFVAWITMTSSYELFTYGIVLISATIFYMGIGTVLLLRFAPRNFKLR
jgi:hypothetical protein